MSNDLIKNVFGSDSDDSDSEDDKGADKAAAGGEEEEEAGDGEDDDSAREGKQKKRRTVIEASDDDEPGAEEPKFRSSLEDPEQLDDDEDDEDGDERHRGGKKPAVPTGKSGHVCKTDPKSTQKKNRARPTLKPFQFRRASRERAHLSLLAQCHLAIDRSPRRFTYPEPSRRSARFTLPITPVFLHPSTSRASRFARHHTATRG